MRSEQKRPHFQRRQKAPRPCFRKAHSSATRWQVTKRAALITAAHTCFEAPFGEVVRKTGPASGTNPFRFSTKYQDDETELLYYGERYYNASTSRWLSRDPLGERGGANTLAFVRNSPTLRVDSDGRADLSTTSLPPRQPPKCQSRIDESKFTVTVSHCEIVIVFGHTESPWTFAFNDPCSAGGIVACWPGLSNRRISQPVEGLEMHEKTCWWLPEPGEPDTHLNDSAKLEIVQGREDGVELDLRIMLGKAMQGATVVAKRLCKENCCSKVLIRGHAYTLATGGNRHIPPGFTITWDCAKGSGYIYSDDGRGPVPWPL
jgi:RHS repeat-associated protein